MSDDFARALSDGAAPEFDKEQHVILRTNKEILRLRGTILLKEKGRSKRGGLREPTFNADL